MKFAVCVALMGAVLVGSPAFGEHPEASGVRGPDVPAFWVRPGYRVDVAATDIEHCRFLETDGSTLFISSPKTAQVFALGDADDGRYEKRATFVRDFPSVHGLDWHDGWLYFTQASDGSCHRARDTNADGVADEVEVVLEPGSVPAGGGHHFRAVLVTDDKIYISVSDPGNMTAEVDSDRMRIYEFNHDGSNKAEFCWGIRNTEKLRLRPGTDEIWGADHGSDWFGAPYGTSDDRRERQRETQKITDLNPPDELNHYERGKFYGHPWVMADRTPRLELWQRDPELVVELAQKTEPAAWPLGSHWASNGFTFLAEDHFPDLQGDMLIAFHGSWNSSERVGYCIERILFDDVTGRPMGNQTIVSTLSDSGQVLARPVDAVEMPDGTVLWSCDATGKVFRLSRAEEDSD